MTHSVSNDVEYSDSVDWKKEGLVTSVCCTIILCNTCEYIHAPSIGTFSSILYPCHICVLNNH